MAIANAPKRNFDKAPLITALQALLGDRCSLQARSPSTLPVLSPTPH